MRCNFLLFNWFQRAALTVYFLGSPEYWVYWACAVIACVTSTGDVSLLCITLPMIAGLAFFAACARSVLGIKAACIQVASQWAALILAVYPGNVHAFLAACCLTSLETRRADIKQLQHHQRCSLRNECATTPEKEALRQRRVAAMNTVQAHLQQGLARVQTDEATAATAATAATMAAAWLADASTDSRERLPRNVTAVADDDTTPVAHD